MFLDYLGQPIREGDIIVYPTAVGSSSADLNMARVEVIDPIVPDPSGHGYCYESMKNKAKHATVSFPRSIEYHDGKRIEHREPWRAYGLKIKKLYEGRSRFGKHSFDNADRLFTLRNVDRVVVVTDINGSPVEPRD